MCQENYHYSIQRISLLFLFFSRCWIGSREEVTANMGNKSILGALKSANAAEKCRVCGEAYSSRQMLVHKKMHTDIRSHKIGRAHV
jgi:hypothetical protein